MNISEAKDYESILAAAAQDWVNGNASIDNKEELAIIASHYGVDLPSSARYFVASDGPNHVKAVTAHKSLLKLLGTLKTAIKQKGRKGGKTL